MSCGKPIAQLFEEFKEKSKKSEEKSKIMDSLGLKRYCCRAIFLGHVDLLETIASFKKS